MLISKIRKYSWVVVGLIALSLVMFLLQDATNSNTGIFNKNKAPKFAEIDGEEVSRDEFSERRGKSILEYLTFNNQVIAYEQGQFQLDPQTEFSVGEQAWTDFVNEKLIDKNLSELGLAISENEFSNLIYGPDPHPVIKNYYVGLSQTGQYDPSVLPGFVENISNPETQQNNPQARQEYYQFVSREQVAKRDYKQTKYMSLFTKSAYVPEWLAKRSYTVSNTRGTFTMISLPYTQIADSTITTTDADLKKYYNENKNKFKQTEGRVVEYVSWEFLPTAKDSAETLKALNENLVKMAASKSDSAYMIARSDDPDKFGNSYYSRTDLYAQGIDSTVVSNIYAQAVGALVGPFENGGMYRVAKIKNRSAMPDSVKARLIVVGITPERDSVKAKGLADSLLAVLGTGGDFAALAAQYSDDQQSGQQGGDIGWATPSMNYIPEFKKYFFETGTTGKTSIIKTANGYQIIEITEMSDRKELVNVAFMSKTISAGKETIDSIEKAATAFYEKYQTPEDFEQGVIDNKLFKRVTQPLAKNMYEVPGIENTREMITWAFDAEKAEFKFFNMSERVIVAYIKEVRVNGIADVENVREIVEQEVIKEKKAEQLGKQIKDAMSAGSMDAVAAKLGVRMDTVRNASFGSPNAPILGREPKVISTISSTEIGKTSNVVAGVRGVYVVAPIEFTPVPETSDYTINKNQLTYTMQNKYQGQTLLNELKEKAKVTDNRYLYGE
ncbi:MAG: peptidylprolyl isomerase [Bacteroidetes bacterium]|nr:peptidylprolyl isomerase [Bacteroidota bacterium]